MHKHLRLASLTLLSSMLAAACGGGGDASSVAPPPPPPVSDADRATAAQATIANNPLCSVGTLGPYYWEVGDANGAKVAGSVGPLGLAPTANTTLWVFSSSKWLYAANVVQQHGYQNGDIPYLNFTSGYSTFGNFPTCPGTTVDDCFLSHSGAYDPTTAGRFAYDSGHMQHHASAVMGLGPANNAGLAANLNATIGGNLGFGYTVPQLAAGVTATPNAYASFLRMLLRGQLVLSSGLGSFKVCTWTSQPPSTTQVCNAAFSPEGAATEAWNYSLGHWVEDDPAVGDHAFSSAGGGGFYPWIDAGKTYYGMIAREHQTESAAGFHSAQCGRLVRQAWMTGVAVPTASVPTPTR